MEGCGWIVVAVVIVTVVIMIIQANAREKARREYQDALSQLKRDPANPNLRQETLALGRVYSNLMRNRRGVALFDEVALSNDINAACAGAAQPQQRAISAQRPSIETRLTNLSDLRAKGLIDEDEYSTRRREILRDV